MRKDKKIRFLAITVCHHSVSLVIPNSDPLDRYFYHNLTLMIESTMTIIYPFNSLHAGYLFMLLLSSVDFFQNYFFSQNTLKSTTRMPKSLDLDQDQHSVSPDLGPNCLQRLSADNKSRSRKELSTTVILTL